jgi:Tfp pilus assembly protein PilN
MMRDPYALARALLVMGAALLDRNVQLARAEARIVVLDRDNAAAYARIEELQNRLAEWEEAADTLGPVRGLP